MDDIPPNLGSVLVRENPDNNVNFSVLLLVLEIRFSVIPFTSSGNSLAPLVPLLVRQIIKDATNRFLLILKARQPSLTVLIIDGKVS